MLLTYVMRVIAMFLTELQQSNLIYDQARNQEERWGRNPPEKFSPPLEKCVGRSLKLLDTVQKIWAPLRKLFATSGVPSWLRACMRLRFLTLRDCCIQLTSLRSTTTFCFATEYAGFAVVGSKCKLQRICEHPRRLNHNLKPVRICDNNCLSSLSSSVRNSL